VKLAAEEGSTMVAEITPRSAKSGSIHIELPGRALVSVEACVDTALVRTVLESLLR
jgi:hypothetical protein